MGSMRKREKCSILTDALHFLVANMYVKGVVTNNSTLWSLPFPMALSESIPVSLGPLFMIFGKPSAHMTKVLCRKVVPFFWSD
jgi:hypothetical protein